jgi:RNA polymerase sigma-70 factor, ECF subfamily
VMIKAARALPGYRGEASPRTWLFRIATNAAHDWSRAHRGPVHEEPQGEGEDAPDPAIDATQERLLVRREMSACVEEYLRRLPADYQTVLALSEREDLSDGEIAEVLGISLGAAKIRLHRARARLRAELERGCALYRDERDVLCCEPREYPSAGDARLPVESCSEAAPSKESVMPATEILPAKTKKLIGVGASVAAGCQPCTHSFAEAARAAGACDRGVRLAIEAGLGLRARAAGAMQAWSLEDFAHPEIDAAFRAERVALEALINLAAAVAVSSASEVTRCLAEAARVGVSAEQVRVAAEIARVARRGAEREVDKALAAVLPEVISAAPAPAKPGGCGCGCD